MIAIISILIFAGALALAIGVIAMAVGPQWRRIARLAMGEVETSFTPLQQLALAERRIAVRRWASAPIHARLLSAPLHRMRAAA